LFAGDQAWAGESQDIQILAPEAAIAATENKTIRARAEQ
jgi:hypothetical protein